LASILAARNQSSREEADVKEPTTLALAIVMAFSMLLFADRGQVTHDIYLVTNFDFARYPACDLSQNTNCILAIRFYDGDSNLRLAQVETIAMRGPRRIVAMAKTGTLPHRVYAVTVYLDSNGEHKEGPPGQMSMRMPSAAN
jgi:hypothetical protein